MDLTLVMYGVSAFFCLIGGTMLGVGIWMAVDSEAEVYFLQNGLDSDLYYASVYIMITVGCLLFLVAFVGMFGAYKSKDSKGVLFVFIGIVCLVLVLELTMIIITGVFWDSIDVDTGTKLQWQDEVKNQYVNEMATDNVSVKWNNMQLDWECCGAEDYNDWDESNYKEATTFEVPWTCCVMKDGGRTLDQVFNLDACRYDATKNIETLRVSDYLNTRGCYHRMNDLFEDNSIILIALTVAFIAVEVGGLVIAFLLIRGGG